MHLFPKCLILHDLIEVFAVKGENTEMSHRKGSTLGKLYVYTPSGRVANTCSHKKLISLFQKTLGFFAFFFTGKIFLHFN